MKNTLVRNIQILITVVAIILIAVFSVSPLLSFKQLEHDKVDNEIMTVVGYASKAELKATMSGNGDLEAAQEKYSEIYDYILNEDNKYVELSPLDFVKTLPDTVKFIIAWVNVMNYDVAVERLNDMSLESYDQAQYDSCVAKVEEYSKKLDEIDYNAINLKSIEQFKLLSTDIIVQLIDTVQSGDFVHRVISQLIIATVRVILLLTLLVFFPISMIFAVLKILGIIFTRNPDVKLGKAMVNANKTFAWLGLILGLLSIWESQLTSKGRLVLIVAGVSILVNIVASRFKSYSHYEIRYLNCMQITSLISLVGVALFAIYVTKANLVSFWTSDYVEASIALNSSDEGAFTNAMIVISYFAALLALMLPFVFRGIISILSRIGCMDVNRKKAKKVKRKKVGTGIFLGVFIVAVNFVIMNLFSVELPEEQGTAFTVACVGVAIALIGKVAMTAIRFTYLSGMSHAEAIAVLSGTPSGPSDADEDDEEDDDYDEE
ncbi:MAG: hypothetical protein E7596_02910 [Ruminococcaceae bacterium]|nr:hypothetical protein [Oscillospiraceae bacterium]